jgi:hypothetical protein
VPEFVCWIAAVVGKSAMTHYIDDYMVFDTMAAKGSAQGVLHAIHDMLRRMPLDEGKNQASGAKATVLGVKCDIERRMMRGLCCVSRRMTDVSVFWNKCVIVGMQGLEVLWSLKTAASLTGKLQFTLTSMYCRLGRAALQPLLQRMYKDRQADKGWRWTTSMDKMLKFFEAIFAVKATMRREVLVRAPEKKEGVVLVYTDASYEPGPGGVKHLGIVVWDDASDQRWFASAPCPQEMLDMFRSDKFIIC